MWKIKKNLGAGDPSVPQSKLASKSSEQTALKRQNIKKKIPSQILLHLLAFATMVTIPPQKRNMSTLFLIKGTIDKTKINFKYLLAVFFPSVGVSD